MRKTILRLLLFLICLGAAVSLVWAESALKTEPTATSHLTGIELPPPAMRLLDQKMTDDLEATLEKQSGKKFSATEVLGWGSDAVKGPKEADVRNTVNDRLKKIGYTVSDAPKASSDQIAAFALTRDGQNLMAFWQKGDVLLLAFCVVRDPPRPRGRVRSGSRH